MVTFILQLEPHFCSKSPPQLPSSRFTSPPLLDLATHSIISFHIQSHPLYSKPVAGQCCSCQHLVYYNVISFTCCQCSFLGIYIVRCKCCQCLTPLWECCFFSTLSLFIWQQTESTSFLLFLLLQSIWNLAVAMKGQTVSIQDEYNEFITGIVFFYLWKFVFYIFSRFSFTYFGFWQPLYFGQGSTLP